MSFANPSAEDRAKSFIEVNSPGSIEGNTDPLGVCGSLMLASFSHPKPDCSAVNDSDVYKDDVVANVPRDNQRREKPLKYWYFHAAVAANWTAFGVDSKFQ